MIVGIKLDLDYTHIAIDDGNSVKVDILDLRAEKMMWRKAEIVAKALLDVKDVEICIIEAEAWERSRKTDRAVLRQHIVNTCWENGIRFELSYTSPAVRLINHYRWVNK